MDSTVLVQVVVPTVREILGIPECPVGGPVRLALGVALGRLPLLGGISLAFPLGGCVTFAGLSPLGLPRWGCGLVGLLGLTLALGGGLLG